MSELNGLLQATNLPAAGAEVLPQLLRVWERNRQRNWLLNQYYEGESPTRSIGIDNIPDSIRPGVACDWAAKAVNSVSERVRLDTFTGTDGQDLSVLEPVPTGFNRVTASLLTHGCAFVTVNQTTTGVPRARFHSAENAAALWDYDRQELAAGLVIADRKLTDYSPNTPVPVQVNLYLPGRIIVFTRSTRQAMPWSSQVLPLGTDRLLMQAIAYRPTGNKPLGQSRITRTVRYLVDEVKRTLLYMAISGAVYATPMMALLGVPEEQYDELTGNGKTSFLMKAGEWFIATSNPDTGSPPELKMMAGQNPTPYIQALEGYAKLFSGATGVPLNSLGIVQDNPSSAEAIEVSREDIITAAEDLIESATPVLRDVARLLLAIRDDTVPELVEDVPEPVFRNPSRPSLAATADAMVKIASVLPGFSGTQEFLQGMGFTGVETDRIRREIRQSAAREALIASLAGQTTTLTAADVDEAEADSGQAEPEDTTGENEAGNADN